MGKMGEIPVFPIFLFVFSLDINQFFLSLQRQNKLLKNITTLIGHGNESIEGTHTQAGSRFLCR